MFKLVKFQSNNFVKFLPDFRSSYTFQNMKGSAHVYKVKPEDIPQDIWAEKKDPKYTDVEEVKDRWYYVERLFPKLRVPIPPKTLSSVGWKAPAEIIPDLPYFIKRTRNHMLPVHLNHLYKDKVLVTHVKYVNGDIWLFEHDLKTYLEEKLGEKVESNVLEVHCKVNFKGDHVENIKEWLYNKGFDSISCSFIFTFLFIVILKIDQNFSWIRIKNN